jgi:hypothetical protein
MKRYIRNMSLIDTVMTSITDPKGSMDHLLKERETPPYIVSCVICLLGVFMIPTFIYQYRYNLAPVQLEITYSLIITLSITFVFFILFQLISLRVIGISAPAIRVLAVTVYALTPMIPLMVGYYIANWIAIGHVSVVTYFVTGHRAYGDWFLTFFPYFIHFGIFFAFLVFSAGMRVIGNMGLPTGLIMGVIAIPLLLGAYFVGATCAEAIYPGTVTSVTKWLWKFTQAPT